MKPLGDYNVPKLSDWEAAELRVRALGIMSEHPIRRYRRDGTGRWARLRWLAKEYGIDLRTLYRYLKRTA